jgi:hypothetical protein
MPIRSAADHGARAADARKMAEETSDLDFRRAMTTVASGYEALAQNADAVAARDIGTLRRRWTSHPPSAPRRFLVRHS